jgi:integrase
VRLPASSNHSDTPVLVRDQLPGAVELARLVAQAEVIFQAARAGSTLRAYRHDWKKFRLWCEQHRLDPLPASPECILLYATDLAKNEKRRLNTLQRRLAAVSQMHQQTGFASPTRAWAVRQFLSGLKRELGVAPRRKRPLLTDDLKQILGGIPDGLLGARDRALLLLGFAGAFRRSELVALDVADLEDRPDGLVVQIRKSKTDQEGEGRAVGIPCGADPASCPVAAVCQWRKVADIQDGPLFRRVNRHGKVLPQRLSPEAVAIVVKRYAKQLGLDSGDFAGHSLRSGLATSAAAAGKSERAIMNQTGHRNVTTVRRYIRDGSLFLDNAAGGIGL